MNASLEEYAEHLSMPEDEVLRELYRQTHLKALYARMISSPQQGRLLYFISSMLQARKILEIGTFTGYSAICLARGMPAGGTLHTIEINEELESFAAYYFEKAGLSGQIKQHIGHAADLIPEMQGPFDLVFLDANKENYPLYYELVLDKIRPAGILIADNVLWGGKVLDAAARDKESLGIKLFNAKVRDDHRVEQLILPIRDGISLIRKKVSF